LTLLVDDLLYKLLNLSSTLLIARQEQLTHCVAAELRENHLEGGAQELIWRLEEDSRPIASVWVRPGGSAMLKIGKRNECPFNHTMARRTNQLSDKCDAAGVVLVTWVVEPGPAGSRRGFHLSYWWSSGASARVLIAATAVYPENGFGIGAERARSDSLRLSTWTTFTGKQPNPPSEHWFWWVQMPKSPGLLGIVTTHRPWRIARLLCLEQSEHFKVGRQP
jgi:hypothetical protein